jgi:hypothetical protein
MLLAESLLGSSSVAANYIEDVFSTYLYTGNSTSGGTQTITNSVDLSTKGGMVWIKGRSAASNNVLFDTARGAGTTASNNQAISSNLGTGEDLGASYDFLSAFNTDGFTVTQGGTTTAARATNYNNVTYASWTFRKQAKFFDIVTYTGNGTDPRNISHNLGSVPGCIIVKPLNFDNGAQVYHRSIGATQTLQLNSTGAAISDSGWQSTAPTSSVFTVGSGNNSNTVTYVAYLFAHDAGGFGATGSDNVISCGSYTGTGAAGNFVSLGYEPQWVLIKRSDATQDWFLFDNMRGIVTGTGGDLYLNPNTNGAEGASGTYIAANATGFTLEGTTSGFNSSGGTYIYIAIRRGPMKTPTTGTSVFASTTYTGAGTTQTVSSGLQTAGGSMVIIQDRFNSSASRVYDTLRGPLQEIYTQATNAEVNRTSIDAGLKTFNMNGFTLGSYNYNGTNESGLSYVAWQLRRAPGFFDVVCYTGDGVAGRTVSHNLTVAPELMFVKSRSDGTSQYAWATYVQSLGNTKYLYLNTTDSEGVYTQWNNTSPTATNFTLGSYIQVNASGSNFVAYLFASCPGVSKVGSYTGTGTTKQIDCGFTGGARFVLIKRTDSTGDWYVWDSARGIVAGNDPYLLLNSSAAEVTNTDYVDTYSAGFEISSTAPAAINANGGSYIFLAIA